MRLIVILAICISLLSLPNVQGQEIPAASGTASTPQDSPTTLLANGTRLVSSRKPDGMILSQGNLYFTSHDAAGAAVWRTAQTSIPGQETILYWEPGAVFGDITFANVNGSFFGYFFATKTNRQVVTIKRVSLTGGAATVLATIPTFDLAKTHRNLVTDGVNLYWQDKTSVRKLAIGGGASTVLDTTPATAKPTAGVDIKDNRVLYASGNNIRFVPTAGTFVSPTIRTLVTTLGRVTTLHVLSSVTFYWGEENGTVRRKIGPNITTLESKPGFVPTSIAGFPISPEAWTQCSSEFCELRRLGFVVDSRFPIDAEPLGISVNSSSGPLFWGDAAGIHRPDDAHSATASSPAAGASSAMQSSPPRD